MTIAKRTPDRLHLLLQNRRGFLPRMTSPQKLTCCMYVRFEGARAIYACLPPTVQLQVCGFSSDDNWKSKDN